MKTSEYKYTNHKNAGAKVECVEFPNLKDTEYALEMIDLPELAHNF